MDCVILLFLLLVLNCFEKLLSAVFGVGGGGVALWILLPFSRFCEIFSKIGVNFCSFVVLFTVVVVVLPVVVHFLVGLFFFCYSLQDGVVVLIHRVVDLW